MCEHDRVQCSALHVPPGLILIGDAAHAVTPVGGQGCNSALEDCEVLDQVLERSGAPIILLMALPELCEALHCCANCSRMPLNEAAGHITVQKLLIILIARPASFQLVARLKCINYVQQGMISTRSPQTGQQQGMQTHWR